ncbi:MAG: DUF3857 domain-containing transglutaminase family protein [Candidatus Cloacimonetes bacterium]|nr:DUF3857 domain-containing transglutaminase family protein [Candidatus Cloacimonadota bacterium]
MIKKIFTLLLIVLAFNLFADRIDEIINDVPGLNEYPDASALNVLTEIEIIVEEDFSSQRHIFYVKKILNYKGKKRYSDVKITYNADFEEVELGHCFAIDTEGSRIEIPENQIYDMNDTESIMSPNYINFREKIINFPQIEPGYFVVVDYTIINKRCEPVNGVEHLKETNPYLNKIFTIKFPKKFKLNYHHDKDIVNFTKKEEGKFDVYSWNVKNTVIYKEENNSPSLLISGTPIVFSFYKDWHELAVEKLSKLKNIETDASITELAKTITENCDDDESKVLTIYKYIAENFNEKKSYISEIDFTPEPLSEVFEKKFGSEKDLTALFIALLKSAGIKDVYPAVILSKNNRFSEIQEKYAVNNFMDNICVFWNNDLFIPGNSYMPFAFTGNNEANILVGDDKYELIKYKTENTVYERNTFNYSVKKNSAKIIVESESADNMNFRKRQMFLNMPDAQRKIWFNQSLGEKSAKLTDGPNFLNFDNINENLKMTYTLEYSDFLVDQKPYKYFKMLPLNFSLDVTLNERDNDYQIFNKIFIRENFIIDISDIIKKKEKIELLNSINKTTEFVINDRIAYFKMESKIEKTKIIINREIYIPECIVSNSMYSEFKQFILSIQNPINNMVFLK